MNPFHTVSVPHQDILEGRTNLEVYAANLWDVYRNKGPDEYRDAQVFFRKTHMTRNLEQILRNLHGRLLGTGGSAFQHIETPFGGGKTHALIAMYHRAKEWGAETVVMVGTGMDATKDTMWGMIEEQLDGRIRHLGGSVAPGRERIQSVIDRDKPVLILIDEMLQYVIKAAGVRVGDTTLAAQTMAFIQELSEAVSSLDRVCVVASFPASTVEMADEGVAAQLLGTINKVSGRIEQKITPVDPEDIPDIIRTRLFSTPERDIRRGARYATEEYAELCERERILPPNTTAVQYRERFVRSYPFLPDVIDVLYEQWGSYSTFQRTRGVLRLLAMVVHSLKTSEKPYITLADFDLSDSDIRRELVKHIGNEFDSVVTRDITGSASGASKVDSAVGVTNLGLKLGTRAATCVFLCSFSGGGTDGASLDRIKRSLISTSMLSGTVITEAVEKFKNHMFYLVTRNSRYLFTNEPNINHHKVIIMEGLHEDVLLRHERSMLDSVTGDTLQTKIWPRTSRDLSDSTDVTLAVMPRNDRGRCAALMDSTGDSPRVYRNAMLFLCPSDVERGEFTNSQRSMLALETILSDDNIRLREDQRRHVRKELDAAKDAVNRLIRQYYRILYVPASDGLEEMDLGMPPAGEGRNLDRLVYEHLRGREIHDELGPAVLKEEYLKHADHAGTEQMYESMLSSPGSRRPMNRHVVEACIARGVRERIFGLGYLEDGVPICRYYGQEPTVSFSDTEVIIRDPAVLDTQSIVKCLDNVDHINTGDVFRELSRVHQGRIGREAMSACIARGVRERIFGLGYLEDGVPVCRYYGQEPTVSFSDTEVIIRDPAVLDTQSIVKCLDNVDHINTGDVFRELSRVHQGRIGREAMSACIARGVRERIFGLGYLEDGVPVCRYYGQEPTVSFSDTEVIIRDPPEQDGLRMRLVLPRGKISEFTRILALLNMKFDSLDIAVKSKSGSMPDSDVENIREACRQIDPSSQVE